MRTLLTIWREWREWHRWHEIDGDQFGGQQWYCKRGCPIHSQEPAS